MIGPDAFFFQNPANGWPMILVLDESGVPEVLSDEDAFEPENARTQNALEAERDARTLSQTLRIWWLAGGKSIAAERRLHVAAHHLKMFHHCADILD